MHDKNKPKIIFLFLFINNKIFKLPFLEVYFHAKVLRVLENFLLYYYLNYCFHLGF